MATLKKMRRLLGVGTALVMAMSAAQAMAKEVSIGYVDGWADSVDTTNVAAEVIKPGDVVVGDVPSILAQMRGDAVGAGGNRLQGGADETVFFDV